MQELEGAVQVMLPPQGAGLSQDDVLHDACMHCRQVV